MTSTSVYDVNQATIIALRPRGNKSESTDRSVWSVQSVLSVWFIWFNQIDEIDQINQIDRS